MKCSLLFDQGENNGNCKKTGRKKGRTSEESCTGRKKGCTSEEGGTGQESRRKEGGAC